MTTKNSKQDNEVYILGAGGGAPRNDKKTPKRRWLWVTLLAGLLLATISVFINLSGGEETPEYYFEPEQSAPQSISVVTTDSIESLKESAYIEVLEETVNDVPLTVFIPHHATMSLVVGMPDNSDSTIVFAAMAADIRKDNKQIVGDFVLSGQRLARGVAKKGFVAIEGNKITVGTGESTPLLQQVIDNNGSFFRQYPLVNNGELVENNPKNKSIRRALAVRNEQVLMVESKNKESFHDFSQALIDIGVSDAIYLVGGDAYGWFYDKERVRHEFGEAQSDLPESISYIIWR